MSCLPLDATPRRPCLGALVPWGSGADPHGSRQPVFQPPNLCLLNNRAAFHHVLRLTSIEFVVFAPQTICS